MTAPRPFHYSNQHREAGVTRASEVPLGVLLIDDEATLVQYLVNIS